MASLMLRADTSALIARIAKARGDQVAAKVELVAVGSAMVIAEALRISSGHVDTGRYRRALGEAGNKAGVGSFELQAVGPSRMQVRIIELLTKQVTRWQRWYDFYVKNGRQGEPYFRKVTRRLKHAKEQLSNFLLYGQKGAIVFDLYSAQRNASVRIRFNNYGGDGRIRVIGDQAVVQIHNKEPHASIVESRFGIMKQALRVMKGSGFERVARKRVVKMLAA